VNNIHEYILEALTQWSPCKNWFFSSKGVSFRKISSFFASKMFPTKLHYC